MLSTLTTLLAISETVISLGKLFFPVIMHVVKTPKWQRREAPKKFEEMVREGIGSPPGLKKI